MSPRDPRLPDNVRALRPADAERLLQDLVGHAAAPSFGQLPERTPPEPWAAPSQARLFTVMLALDDLEPLIWRRLAVAGDVTLDELHGVLQEAMGWTDSHLHRFVMGPGERDHGRLPFVEPYAESEGDDGIVERDIRLDQVLAEEGDRLYYDYDFGDGWEHTITVEAVKPLEDDSPRATCLDGARACPPEDVGGVPGYEEVLEALERPGAPVSDWMRQVLDWLPEGFYPSKFDLARTDELVRRAAVPTPELPPAHLLPAPLVEVVAGLDDRGAAMVAHWCVDALAPVALDAEAATAITAPWRMLLDTVGDGMALTGAGYLPPAVVSALIAGLPVRNLWGKGNREEHTPPVADLHQTARTLGLVRKAKGRLLPTTLGTRLRQDPDALVRHLAARLTPGKKPNQREAEWLVVLAAAAGVIEPYDDVAQALSGMGWRQSNGALLRRDHPYHWAHHPRAVLGLAGWNPGKYDDLSHDPRARILAQLAVQT